MTLNPLSSLSIGWSFIPNFQNSRLLLLIYISTILISQESLASLHCNDTYNLAIAHYRERGLAIFNRVCFECLALLFSHK